MKCPACKEEIGYHAFERGKDGKMEPPIRRCPNTGQVVTLDPRIEELR